MYTVRISKCIMVINLYSLPLMLNTYLSFPTVSVSYFPMQNLLKILASRSSFTI